MNMSAAAADVTQLSSAHSTTALTLKHVHASCRELRYAQLR